MKIIGVAPAGSSTPPALTRGCRSRRTSRRRSTSSRVWQPASRWNRRGWTPRAHAAREPVRQRAQRKGPADCFEISGVEVHSFADTVLGGSRPAIIAVTLAVALLLVIACVNVGNLVLVRLLGRTREVAVRRALGASYVDVARLFLESGMLGIAGGVVGLLTAIGLLRIVHAVAPVQLPRTDSLAPRARRSPRRQGSQCSRCCCSDWCQA